MLIIWAVAFVLLLVLLIVAVISSTRPSSTEQVPLVRDSSVNLAFSKVDQYIDSDSSEIFIDINDETVDKLVSRDLSKVYSIKNVDFEGIIDKFLIDNGLGEWEKNSSQYVSDWKEPGSSNSHISLIKPTYKLNLAFDNPVELKTVPTAALTEDLVEKHFYNVISKNFSSTWEYTNVEVESLDSGNTYKVTANRKINDNPLYNAAGYNELQDYIVFTSAGDLVMGKLTYLDVGTESAENYRLIRKENLLQFVNSSSENRIIFTGQPEFLEGTPYDWSKYPYFTNEVTRRGPFPKLTQCQTERAEIGYMYLDSEIKKIYPIYALQCSQEVSYEGGIYEIPALVLVDAIDPEYTK